jgi:hypothetical protein
MERATKKKTNYTKKKKTRAPLTQQQLQQKAASVRLKMAQEQMLIAQMEFDRANSTPHGISSWGSSQAAGEGADEELELDATCIDDDESKWC